MTSELTATTPDRSAQATPHKKLKVLMIWPYRERGIAAQMFDYTLDILKFKDQIPPVGLLVVAGYLPREWDLKLVDVNVRQVTDEEIDWADYVFTSGIVGQEVDMLATAKRVRARGKHIIAGGSYINSSGFRVEAEFDTICQGEAEPYIHKLVADMEAGTVQKKYGDGEKCHFDRMEIKPPRWDLLGPDAQKQYFLATLETSRGCPFNCEFCDIISVFGRKPRYKTPEQVTTELDLLIKHGWKGALAIIDDNLIGGNKECDRLLDTLIEWQEKNGYPFYFCANVSMNMAEHDDHIEKFMKAGIRIIFVGVESPNVESLKETGKRQNIRGDMLGRLHKLIKAGLELEYGMIIGFDHDTVQTLEQIDKFIEDSNVPNALFQILQALDNTQLYDRLKAEGRLYDESHGHDQKRIKAGVTNFKTNIPEDQLSSGYAKVLEHVYNPKVYYERVYRFIMMLGDRHRENVHHPDFTFNFQNFGALVMNLSYGFDRWSMFKTMTKLLWKGGWWRFWKFQSYVIGGISYIEHFLRIAKSIRDNLPQRHLSMMPPEGGGGGHKEEHAPLAPVGRLPVVG